MKKKIDHSLWDYLILLSISILTDKKNMSKGDGIMFG